MSAILTPENATPRCRATVELISKVMRPWLFLVTVIGEPPHEVRRVYPIAAPDDNSAAMKGMELFVAEVGRQLPGVGTVVPRARLA